MLAPKNPGMQTRGVTKRARDEVRGSGSEAKRAEPDSTALIAKIDEYRQLYSGFKGHLDAFSRTGELFESAKSINALEQDVEKFGVALGYSKYMVSQLDSFSTIDLSGLACWELNILGYRYVHYFDSIKKHAIDVQNENPARLKEFFEHWKDHILGLNRRLVERADALLAEFTSDEINAQIALVCGISVAEVAALDNTTGADAVPFATNHSSTAGGAGAASIASPNVSNLSP